MSVAKSLSEEDKHEILSMAMFPIREEICYSVEQTRIVLNHLGLSKGDEQAARIINQIEGIVFDYFDGLNLKKLAVCGRPPTPSTRKRNAKSLAKLGHNFQRLLRSLDTHETLSISRFTGLDLERLYLEIEQLTSAGESFASMDWPIRGPNGRPKTPSKFEFVSAMAKIFWQTTGVQPTRKVKIDPISGQSISYGSFIEFLNESVRPFDPLHAGTFDNSFRNYCKSN